MDTAAKLAVLIDADNAQPTTIEALLAEVAKYGTAHVKRAYGDWTGTSLRGWKDLLLSQSIQPCRGSILRTCGGLRLLEDLRGSLVLVDQPAEDRSSPYSALLVEIDDGGRWARRQQVQGPMRPAVVVVLHILGQDMA